jgi:hypothetical protein
VSCVLATNSFSTKSSSLTAVAERAATAPALRAVFADRLRLGIAAVRERHDHVLRRDQVFDREVGFVAARCACGARRRTGRGSAISSSRMTCSRRSGRARMSRESRIVRAARRIPRGSCPARDPSAVQAQVEMACACDSDSDSTAVQAERAPSPSGAHRCRRRARASPAPRRQLQARASNAAFARPGTAMP